VRNFSYLAVLGVCLLGTLPLEFKWRAFVYRRPRRLAIALAPVLLLFTLWDIYAIASGHWTFDSGQTTGIIVLAGVPLEEISFFIAIPICALLTYEAVANQLNWSSSGKGRS
jgi:lycopene cyclase domain-containing protein